jgi:hypothetical protein
MFRTKKGGRFFDELAPAIPERKDFDPLPTSFTPSGVFNPTNKFFEGQNRSVQNTSTL